MFSLQPDLASKIAGHQHWINVDDADGMYKQHLERGAKIVSEIEDKPWGFREYVVEDPSGYQLRFAGPLTTSAPKSAPLPEGLRIERRKPTTDEYFRIAGKAFNYDQTAEEILDGTWNGVVALSPGGEAIGILRVVHDAPGWFSIWDVAVLPEWQARRIGSELMKEALALVQETCPVAIVFLFTTKHGFYERLGFSKGTISMRHV